MTEILQKYLDHAVDSLESAVVLLKADLYAGTINRSYYAMFYCAQGMLSTLGTFPKSHKGIVRKFSELFIITKAIDKKYGAIFQRTFNKRQFSDYEVESNVTKKDAELACAEAKVFVEMARIYFSKN